MRIIWIEWCFLVILFCGVHASAQSYYEIEGIVYGPGGNPQTGVAIFIEDLTRARIGQTITDTDGHYTFSRIAAGTYYVVVQPNDRQLQSAIQRIELINTARVGTNSSVERVDVNLKPSTTVRESIPTTVFAQSIPPNAQSEYERAMANLAKKDSEQAMAHLNKAIQFFPKYFMALQQLGLLYVEREQYREAIPPLVKAIEINASAGASYLALGIASVRLGRSDLALDALERARRIDDKSFRVYFFLGTALLDLNRLDEAEAALKEAYRLGGSKIPSAHLYLASIYSKREHNHEAISELEAYLRELPKAPNEATIRATIEHLRTKP
ncbi:MAG: tetratricopeptide repeat protein [Pyrinomonadaceae bacterium]